MGKAPAFQLYASDFLVDTASWDVTELGIYCRLLYTEWANGPLPNDPKRLARISGCNPKLFCSCWERQIKAKFEISGDGLSLYNRRLEATREKQAQYSETQRERGKKSALKRWGKPITTAIATVITPVTDSVTFRLQPDCNSSSSSSYIPIIPSELEQEKKQDKIPYEEIRLLWCKICTSLPQPRKENNSWHKNCKARYHQYERFRNEGLDWVEMFFKKFYSNPWWESGKWKPPSIKWVWEPEHFWDIVERKDQ